VDNIRNAIKRILEERDFSVAAAANLESAIAESFAEDERFEDLLDVLASYRPGGGEFLFDEEKLESECRRVMKFL